jgi:hypothetical protein
VTIRVDKTTKIWGWQADWIMEAPAHDHGKFQTDLASYESFIIDSPLAWTSEGKWISYMQSANCQINMVNGG